MPNKIQKALSFLIISIGVVLPLVQFFHNRGLWHDEASLALNIIEKSYIELFLPLDYSQAAPILFLIVEKFFYWLIPSELGLRLFPLICYYISFYLFYKILRTLNLRKDIIVFSIAVFVFNITTLYFSNEVKQYMTDLAVTLVLYYFYDFRSNNFYKTKFIVAGIISIFMSHITPIILLSIGIYTLYTEYSDKFLNIQFLKTSAVWLISFGIYFFLFVYELPIKEYMIEGWGLLGGFMPTNIFSHDFFNFLKYFWVHAFFLLFHTNIIVSIALFVLFLLGTIYLFYSKEYSKIILLLGPLVIHLFLSMLKLYPVSQRTILYLMPLFIIIMSEGLDRILSIKKPRKKQFNLIITTVFVFFIGISFWSNDIPVERTEIKKVLKYIDKYGVKDDVIILCFQADISYQFYIKSGLWENKKFKVYHTSHNLEDESMSGITSLNKESNSWLVFTDYCLNDQKKLLKKYKNSGYSLIDTYFMKGCRVYKFIKYKN